MLDIDHFKSINDRFGHLAGDRLLTWLASIIAEETAKVDGAIAARYGGEEFAIAATIDQPKMTEVCTRIRARLSHASFAAPGESILVPVSVGVARGDAYRPAPDPQKLIDAAESALATAKREGRNRLVEAREGTAT